MEGRQARQASRDGRHRRWLTSPSHRLCSGAGRRLSSAVTWRPAAAASGTRCPLVGTLPGLEDDEINATTVPAAMVSDLLALFDLLMVVSLCLKFLNFFVQRTDSYSVWIIVV